MSERMNKKAVALKYDQDKSAAPVVVAKGKGYIAENILKTAQDNGVPLKEDNDLINYLMSLELYEEIPPELYKVIAEVLAFIYKSNQDYK
jgi:flagellar biosynthesis protein